MFIAPCADAYQPVRGDFKVTERGDIEIVGFHGQKICVLEGELPGRY